MVTEVATIAPTWVIEQPPFFKTVWQGVRPHALAGMIDFGQYLNMWAGVFGAHLAKLFFASAGVEAEIIKLVSVIEKWVWIASFFAFFWRILVRLFFGSRKLNL
jgi:hypothetical protein